MDLLLGFLRGAIMANQLMEKEVDKGLLLGKMDQFIQVNFKMIKLMEKEIMKPREIN